MWQVQVWHHISHIGKSSQGAPDIVPLRHSFPTSLKAPNLCSQIKWIRKKWFHPRLQGWRTWASHAIRTFCALCHSTSLDVHVAWASSNRANVRTILWECWDPGTLSFPRWRGKWSWIWEQLELFSPHSQESKSKRLAEKWNWNPEDIMYFPLIHIQNLPISELFNYMNQ